ncbi:hypothetical protein Y032_0021g397 [Ancylostoma ceylanicum]|uniref:Secreted protein n=1 Tax=Ancylostoma ceylanicum TaxID=53326 RepID=A0A016UZX1_9BILA|nr:hypothetical protein Y032_0021g397 [Ancylostoma ceylanicum]
MIEIWSRNWLLIVAEPIWFFCLHVQETPFYNPTLGQLGRSCDSSRYKESDETEQSIYIYILKRPEVLLQVDTQALLKTVTLTKY